jgi:hypothetical protein
VTHMEVLSGMLLDRLSEKTKDTNQSDRGSKETF